MSRPTEDCNEDTPVTNRKLLPARRAAETFNLDFGGYARSHTITVGRYDDGSLGEVFIDGGKSGEQVEAIARDGAVLMSIALQFGTDIETMAKAVTRDLRGTPQSIIGAVIDAIKERESK